MAIMTQLTVGELVAEKARRSKVFERHGIDYCCGGKKPLEQACRETGANLDTVVDDLNALESQPQDSDTDWKSASLTKLADHIEQTHHAYLREALPRLSQLTEKVARVHGHKRTALHQVHAIFSALRDELEPHMMKEEQVLFPMLREMEKATTLPAFHCGTVKNPIRVMEHEHDDAGKALAELNRLTENYVPPEDACGTYRAMLDGLAELESDLHMHIHKENNILFPRGAVLEESLSKG